jgi:hypothetical protein
VHKVFKYTAVSLLWLAGLVILAHLFVAHDHHSECSVFVQADDCHANNTGHPVKSPVFPFHCHVLNDLTFEKTAPVYFVNNNIPTCDLFILNLFDSTHSVSSIPTIKLTDFQKTLIEADFLCLSLFRAPPSLI